MLVGQLASNLNATGADVAAERNAILWLDVPQIQTLAAPVGEQTELL